jgi:UDP-2,3-diacylglucosamine hydrolase
LKGKGKIFFASDFHLGLKAGKEPAEREKLVVRWLNTIAPEAREIFLVGDIFDFWWEYRLVVPRGFTRFLGTISGITDSGIPVHFFTGNHDMWVKDYFSAECGMTVHTSPFTCTIDGRKFHIAHGEGLGSRNTGYHILLRIFRNKPLRVLYSMLHPRIGIGIGQEWSQHSRFAKGITQDFMGEDREDLLRYSRSIMEKEPADYFIFGHRHLPMTFSNGSKGRILFLGDWLSDGSYAEWDGSDLYLKSFS